MKNYEEWMKERIERMKEKIKKKELFKTLEEKKDRRSFTLIQMLLVWSDEKY